MDGSGGCYTYLNESERERKILHVTTLYLESKKYWVGQKVRSSFTITCFGKTQMSFLANLIKQMNECNKTETDSQIKRTSGEREGGEEQDRGRGLRSTNYYV